MDELTNAVGREYGRAYAEAYDRVLLELLDSLKHPEDYWEARVTYRGVGGKRRLQMKVRR